MFSTGDNGLEYIPSGKVFETNYLYCVFLARVTHSKYRFENNTGSKLMLIKQSLYLTKALMRKPMTVLSTYRSELAKTNSPLLMPHSGRN